MTVRTDPECSPHVRMRTAIVDNFQPEDINREVAGQYKPSGTSRVHRTQYTIIHLTCFRNHSLFKVLVVFVLMWTHCQLRCANIRTHIPGSSSLAVSRGIRAGDFVILAGHVLKKSECANSVDAILSGVKTCKQDAFRVVSIIGAEGWWCCRERYENAKQLFNT